jgi:lipopolysaccharide exporter
LAAVAEVGNVTAAAGLRPDLERQVRRGLAWSTLNNVALRAGTFAVGIVLARLLTPHQFGVYAVAFTVQAVLVTLADLGLSADLIRQADPDRRAPTVGALGLVSGALLAVTMAASSHGLASLLGSPEAGPVIAVLAITLVLAGAGVVPYAYLQRRFQQKALFAIALVDFTISTVATVALIEAGWGPMALAVGRVAAQVVVLVLQFVLSGVRPSYRVDRELAGSVLRFGTPIAGANMLSWALLNLDNVVIARVAGATALGFYVLAFNISNWPMSVIGQVVRSVALPTFARSTEGTLDRAVALTWGLALPAGAALSVLATPVVVMVYGARWSAAVPVLAALALFGSLRVVFDLAVAYLLALGSSGKVLAIQVLWFVTLVPAMVIGTRTHGIAGGGWAHLLVSGLVILPAYAVALRRVGADVAALAKVMLPPVAAAIPATAAGLLVTRAVDQVAFQLLLGLAAGAAVYLAILARWLRACAQGRDLPTTPPAPAAAGH